MWLCKLDLFTHLNINLFVHQGDRKMQLIYRQFIEKKNNRFDTVEAVQKVQQGHMAIHHDAESMYGEVVKSFTDRQICDLTTVSFYRPFQCGLQVPKKSPYRELFILGLQPMIESGVVGVERLQFFTPKPKCVKSEVEVMPVTFHTITVPILVLCAGVLGSLLVLIAEIFVHTVLNGKKCLVSRKFKNKNGPLSRMKN